MWYLLSGVLGVTWMEMDFNFCWAGVAKSVVFTLMMLSFAWLLTRARVRLQL
jgi:hypothetical protein